MIYPIYIPNINDLIPAMAGDPVVMNTPGYPHGRAGSLKRDTLDKRDTRDSIKNCIKYCFVPSRFKDFCQKTRRQSLKLDSNTPSHIRID